MNWLLLIAAFPLIWRFIGGIVPAQYVEPYAYWDAASLNTASASGGRVPKWRNMGYWTVSRGKETAHANPKSKDETFTQANEALALRLLQFADAKVDGHTLDMGHGAGESLRESQLPIQFSFASVVAPSILTTLPWLTAVIHINAGVKDLDALTSLPSETAEAEALVDAWSAESGKAVSVNFFTASGGYRPTKDLEHPLNPMRGYMGEEKVAGQGSSGQVVFDDDDKEDKEEEDDEDAPQVDLRTTEAANPYDLVYVLDAAYHFPPAIGYFLATVLPVLRPGSGVLAYTDVLPPPALSKLPLMLTAGWLAPFLHVPRRNINERPATLDEYAAQLEQVGYENVKIEDWTEHVFVPLADNLESRGAAWWAYSKVLRFAQRTGWKFVAVRASRPAIQVQASP